MSLRKTMAATALAVAALLSGTAYFLYSKTAQARVAEVRVLRPQEIPVYVAEGLFDVGITGRDMLLEYALDAPSEPGPPHEATGVLAEEAREHTHRGEDPDLGGDRGRRRPLDRGGTIPLRGKNTKGVRT